MISVQITGYQQALKALDPKKVNQAARMAVKEAASAAKTTTSEKIREHWNIKRKDLDSKFKVRISGSLTRTLSISGPPIGLAYFDAKYVRISSSGVSKSTRGKDGQIKTKTNKSSKQSTGYTAVTITKGRRTFVTNAWIANPRAFAGRAKGGEVLYGERRARVLARVGAKEIVGPKTISVASMFEQLKIVGPVTERTQKVLNERFLHHVNRLFGP